MFCWECVPFFLKFYVKKSTKLCSLFLSFLLEREKGVLCEFFLRLEFVKSLVAPVRADPMWAPFTALRYVELELLNSTREVDLPMSLRLTDSVKQYAITSFITLVNSNSTGVFNLHIVLLTNRGTMVSSVLTI